MPRIDQVFEYDDQDRLTGVREGAPADPDPAAEAGPVAPPQPPAEPPPEPAAEVPPKPAPKPAAPKAAGQAQPQTAPALKRPRASRWPLWLGTVFLLTGLSVGCGGVVVGSGGLAAGVWDGELKIPRWLYRKRPNKRPRKRK